MTKSPTITSPQKPVDAKSWIYRAPPIVSLLIAVMVLVHLVLAILPQNTQIIAKVYGAIVPMRYFIAFNQPVDPLVIWLPPIAHQFLHGGFMHLFLNMMFLLAFGSPVAMRFIHGSVVERRAKPTPWKGSLIFLAFFLIAGVLAGMSYVVLHTKSWGPLIGASGAVSALMAAAMRLMIVPSVEEGARAVGEQDLSHTDNSNAVRTMLPLNDPKLMRFGAAIIGLNVGIGILQFLFVKQGSLIAWEAHIVGYLFGLLALPLFDRVSRSR